MTESVLLSVIGGVLGVCLGSSIVGLARRSLPGIVPRSDTISMDLNVLVFALGLSILTGLLFGLAPIAQLGKRGSLGALREAARTSQPAARARLRTLLVLGQVSLATVLVIGAGLLIQSFARLQRVSPGIDADAVLTARIPLPGQKYGIGAGYSTLLSRFTDALQSAPGVQAAGVSTAIPLGPGAHTAGTAVAVLPSDAALAQPITCAWRPADAGFFAALQIPVLRGRLFDRTDEISDRRVFVVSQEAARALYGGEDPIGRQLRMNDMQGEIIGVVGNVRMRSLSDPPDRVVYLPLSQGGFFAVFSVFVRTQDRPESAVTLIKEKLREIDPNLPAFDFRPMQDWVERSSARARIRTWVLALLAGVAVVVGMIGIYGVLAYVVALRRHEFGVRLALGAQPDSIVKLVLVQGLGLALAGVAAGCAAAMLLAGLLSSLLFGVSGRDPLTFLGVASLLVLAALVACYIPARRAAAVDPLVALRYE